MNIISTMTEKRTIGDQKLDTTRINLAGAITEEDIESLKEQYGEIFEYFIVLYHPPVDVEEAVAEEIASVSATVTELLKGENSDALVKMLDYILDWTQGIYVIGDVRKYNEQPKTCCQAHDSTSNPDWTPDVTSLWSPYHAKSEENALPWVQPTGVQDMYLVNEYMIFTDEKVYKCISDTAYSPTEYAAAWQEIV